MAKASENEIQLHQRLLQREETASSELCEFFLDRLVNHFKAIFAKNPLCNEDLIIDAVTDSLLNFIDNPSQFDPNRGTLENYIKMSAEGDIRNSFDKKQRKYRLVKRKLGAPVELRADSRNSIGERIENPEQSLIKKEIQNLLQRLFPDERDYEIANLIFANVRETKIFAELLGITDLPKDLQRKYVKRAKDRIKAKLKRGNLKKFLE